MVSNYDQFMAALRAERQRELRQTAAGGMQQRHLPSPDTRLVPLPGPKEMVVGFLARPSWLPQLESTGYLFTPFITEKHIILNLFQITMDFILKVIKNNIFFSNLLYFN